MRLPDEALARLRNAWRRHAGDWLGGGGDWPLEISLAPPGERRAMQDWNAFERWRNDWQDFDGAGEVAWGQRTWPSLGCQALPLSWRLRCADEAARALGQTPRWRAAEQRFAEATSAWPALAEHLRRRFEWLADGDAQDFERLLQALRWLLAHPRSGLLSRQLPIAGLDSKWLEAHTGVLGEWLQRLRGADAPGGFWSLSGLRREADRARLRLLDAALRAQVGGLGDIQAPLEELARLPIHPRRLFIVENKQTGLAFEDLADAVVVMARGYAVERLAELPWAARADAVHYWGDIDTHGLAILGRLRQHLPRARSLLMDQATLLAHRPLWVDEPKPHPADAIDGLDATEQALYRDLRNDRFGVRVRLEQERINWAHAWAGITAAG